MVIPEVFVFLLGGNMIVSRLHKVMADRKISVNELADSIGINPVNLSRIRTGNNKGIRLSTLDNICRELRCQPGDIFVFLNDDGFN